MNINTRKKIIIIAGDKSGDVYGGMLAKELTAKYPQLEIYSCGGQSLAVNSQQIIDLLSHSVMGLVEILTSLPGIFKIFNQILKKIEQIKPDMVILIDFPDFNLRLAKKINNRWPVFYYVSPTVWAWRKSRIKTIKKYVNTMVVLFKFEQDFYQKEDINALYFGHPLLEIIKKQNLSPRKIITFMPGSRYSELKILLPIIEETKNILAAKLPGYIFRVIRPENIPIDAYRRFGCTIEIVDRTLKHIEESEFVVVCSGTATLEAAILSVPHLIIYKINPLTWFIAKRLIKINFIGIVNILNKKKIVEEFLQNAANSQNISAYVLETLSDKNKYQTLKASLSNIHCQLLPENATQRLAEHIAMFLKM